MLGIDSVEISSDDATVGLTANNNSVYIGGDGLQIAAPTVVTKKLSARMDCAVTGHLTAATSQIG